MNVKAFNTLLLEGEYQRDDMWPRLLEYESKANPFFFEFGLKELPKEPGTLIIRGPRQYGKSTWLDLQIRETVEKFGKGSALYLNGDSLIAEEALYSALVEMDSLFSRKTKVQRLFIDEITAVQNWERALKRAYDEGLLRKTLIVTTGSKALDLRRGKEKLPGRKGKLAKTEYVFLPISYQQFYKTCGKGLSEEEVWKGYLVSGGSPLAANEIAQFEKVPEYVSQLIQEWILGDIAQLGRSRLYLKNVLNALYRYGGTPVGFAKLAREAGLANNTVASGYIEQLSDLLVSLGIWPWDSSRKQLQFRKPCKFAFINLAAAVAFHEYHISSVHDFNALPDQEKAKLMEWMVGQELWRRNVFLGTRDPEAIGFWQSDKHEVDYVVDGKEFYEVKLGKSGPIEYLWFGKVFPGKKLTVICSTPFDSEHARGLTMHDFLLEGACLDFIREWRDPNDEN